MTYRSRSSRLPSIPNNDADSIYWSAFETFSNVTDRPRPMSRQSASLHSRNYIDPWDLENYAYIQRNMESPEPSPIPSPVEELSTYYHMPGNIPDECPCYAGLDEQLFYNAKYEMMPDEMAYSTYTDLETSSTERNSSCSGGSSVSTLQLHTPGFGVQSHRSIVLPKPMPHIQFPAPPPLPLPLQPSSAYEYYTNVSLPYYEPTASTYRRRHSRCYECLDDQLLYERSRRISSSLYGGVYASIEQPNHFERFGLSKKGLLQIDYSCNWNNLQRLIANK